MMQERRFGHVIATPTITRLHPDYARAVYQPLPPPTGSAPYHLSLETVLGAAPIQAIENAKRLVFHTTGDTGGVSNPAAQQIVSEYQIADLNTSANGGKPAFFYIIGDVVYFYGEAANYNAQFYEPYAQYPIPIFAIPGNHDGDVSPGHPQPPSLDAFVRNFCAPEAVITTEAGNIPRSAMTQPHVYWTLEAPFVTIVGLYTNVPEGGQLDATQIAWFQAELQNAPLDKALIVAMHHPIYSGDTFHSGSVYMGQILDNAIAQTNRVPDLVLAGHVHNYQRFTRTLNGREVPYLVIGAGGYPNLHHEQQLTPGQIFENGVTLETFSDDRHGFFRMEITPDTISGIYRTVPRPQESWRNGPVANFDTFQLNLKTHTVGLLPGGGAEASVS